MSNNKSIILERLFDAPVKRVWQAITDKNEMKSWYFDLNEFKAQPGFQFQFTGEGKNGNTYKHLCEITEVVPYEKLTYSWRYEGYAGISYVTFELFERGNKTLLRLIHTGIESFPLENTDFAKQNFENGWNDIINNSLKGYLDKHNFQHEISVNASLDKVYKSITREINLWWTEMFEGVSDQKDKSFTVRFGPSVFKTMRVEEIIPKEKVVWHVTDTIIDIPELKNKKEWLNTRIVWQLRAEKTKTTIQLTHIGLHPEIECYSICSIGWVQFCDSLKSYLETGKGNAYKREH
jgi:uncharacterized protein YndB with AHSA1/START domain